jgi:hypothetical protein
MAISTIQLYFKVIRITFFPSVALPSDDIKNRDRLCIIDLWTVNIDMNICDTCKKYDWIFRVSLLVVHSTIDDSRDSVRLRIDSEFLFVCFLPVKANEENESFVPED